MECKQSELISGFSVKADGIMKLVGERITEALANRQKFFTNKNIDVNKIVSAGLVHGKTVAVVGEAQAGQRLEATDGLVTATPNLFLTITVADCLPIYFFDPIKKVIGLAHAGWRGVSLNIASATVEVMINSFSTDPKNLIVYIGPHLRSCHFIVQDDVVNQFAGYQKFIKNKANGQSIDLAGIVREQLVKASILSVNISISSECTFDNLEKYFSFRRDKPTEVEAMVAYIGLPI